MAVTTGFTLVVLGTRYVGEISYLLSPALAAWVPLMIFIPLAMGLGESLWK
jgi:hypothetical protein